MNYPENSPSNYPILNILLTTDAISEQANIQFSWIPLIIAVCLAFLGGWMQYLLIIFSGVSRSVAEEWAESKDELLSSKGKQLQSMFQNYHLLVAVLYLVQYLSVIIVSLLLSASLSMGFGLISAILLVLVVVLILPKVNVMGVNKQQTALRFKWLIQMINRLQIRIHCNQRIRNRFQSKTHHQLTLDRQNIQQLLNLPFRKQCSAYRQQQIQLLDKILKLKQQKIQAIMVKRSHMFILDINTPITHKLLYSLSKYYFSKILISQKNADNIVGYFQLHQLLHYSMEGNDCIGKFRENYIVTKVAKISIGMNYLDAVNQMLNKEVNFGLVYDDENVLVGLVKLKDIFSGLVLKWYNYDGLAAEKTYHSLNTLSLNRERNYQKEYTLEEGVEQN